MFYNSIQITTFKFNTYLNINSMKKTLLSFFTIAAITVYSQTTIRITNTGNSQTVAPNAFIDLGTMASNNTNIIFDVTNTGTSTNVYNAKRYDMVLNSGAAAYFCFAGNCYGPGTLVSPNSLTLAPGQSASQIAGPYQKLVADLDEGPATGVSRIKYTFINVANVNDSIQLILRYNDPSASLKEINSSLNNFLISPNPANDFTSIKINSNNNYTGSLSIFNSIGSLVSEKNISVTKGDNKVAVNTSELNTGIYFVSLKAGEAIVTKKLIIK